MTTAWFGIGVPEGPVSRASRDGWQDGTGDELSWLRGFHSGVELGLVHVELSELVLVPRHEPIMTDACRRGYAPR